MMQDKIEDIIQNQTDLQILINQHPSTFKDTSEMVFKYMSAISSEVEEVKQEINWKWWKQPFEIVEIKLKEELADIFIFWLDLIIRLGYNDMWDIIASKQQVNIQRQQGTIVGRENYRSVN